MKKIIDALPLVVFASLIIVLFSFLSDRDDQLETALIDSSFPEFKLGSLSDESRVLTKQDIIKLLFHPRSLGQLRVYLKVDQELFEKDKLIINKKSLILLERKNYRRSAR